MNYAEKLKAYMNAGKGCYAHIPPQEIPPTPNASEWLDSPSAVRKWGMWAMVKIETLDMRINLHAHKTEETVVKDAIEEAGLDEVATNYRGHKLRMPGFLGADERVEFISDGMDGEWVEKAEEETHQLLRDLAPHGVVWEEYHWDSHTKFDWHLVDVTPGSFKAQRNLRLYRIKLDDNGEVPVKLNPGECQECCSRVRPCKVTSNCPVAKPMGEVPEIIPPACG